MTAPNDPFIYHITHVQNLASIIQQGGLWSDAERIRRQVGNVNIGHRHIKSRRLNTPVKTRAGGMIGDYVPFNFCPRSVMLFPVSCGHDDYRGGQDDVVHLVSSVSRAVQLERPWAFTDRHAELAHSLHFDDLGDLHHVPWHVMTEKYWTAVKEERQAEFLVHGFFDWSAVCGVGVKTTQADQTVRNVFKGFYQCHQPPISIQPSWYY